MGRFRLRRWMVQTLAALLQNSHLMGFITGRIYKGKLKFICTPGLNCYSCPGALFACPIGALQAVSTNPAHMVSFYVVGFLMIVGALVGRLVCGFLCPFGLIQELIHQIPVKKIKLGKAGRWLTKTKYLVLAVLVLGIPMVVTASGGTGFPAFCSFLCPAGTAMAGIPLALLDPGVQAAIGPHFFAKLFILAATVVACMFIYRAFCRILCPLGAIYGFFNRISLVTIEKDESKCNHCGLCARVCPMEAENPQAMECIRCGICQTRCPSGALQWRFGRARRSKPAQALCKKQ